MWGIRFSKKQKKREFYLEHLVYSLECIHLDEKIYNLVKLEYSKCSIEELEYEYYNDNPKDYGRITLEATKRFKLIEEGFKGVKKGKGILRLQFEHVLPIMRKVIINHLRNTVGLKVFSSGDLIVINNVNLNTINKDKLNNSLMVAIV